MDLLLSNYLVMIKKKIGTITCLITVGKQVWSGTSSGAIIIWNSENGQLVDYINSYTSPIVNLFILADLVWSVSCNGTICMWKATELSGISSVAKPP